MEPRSAESSELRAVRRSVRSYSPDALRIGSAVAATLPLLLLASLSYGRRWVAEDAFIDLRVVRHLLAGHGPVFNVGERVEAYTNPLWVALLAAWGTLGGSLELGALTMGIVLSTAGLLLAEAGAWRLASRLGAGADASSGRSESGVLVLPVGALVFVAIPAVWDFTTSGLESGLAIAWLGAAFWLLARSRPMTMASSSVAAFTIGCGPLVRPDLALFSLAFGAALAIVAVHDRPRHPGRECLRLGLIGAALPLCYQVFRMGYFAALVPNTALAKEASAAYWTQGWHYTLDFVGTYVLWFPLLVIAAWSGALLRLARRQRDVRTAALVLAPTLSAIAHWLYVTRVGGDFMHGRLLLPTLFAFLLPVATAAVPLRSAWSWRGAGFAAVAGWAVVCALWLRVPYEGQGAPAASGIADERGFYTYHIRTPHPVYVGDYIRQPYVARVADDFRARSGVIAFDGTLAGLRVAAPLASTAPPSLRLVVGLSNVGILGYLAGSDIHVVDRLGLADPIAARLVLTGRGRPGHEKLLPEAWTVARFGDASAIGRFPGAAEAAAALQCGTLARLLRAVEDPLTPSRFVRNIRDAWSLDRLRVPADPAAARTQFCPPPGTRG